MNENGVQINPNEQVSIITDAKTIRALLTLVQRVPMTDLEAVAIETIFGNWFDQIAAYQRMQRDALSKIAAMAGMTPDQPLATPSPNDLETAAQLDQIGDVLAHGSPPDNASGLLPYESDAQLVG